MSMGMLIAEDQEDGKDRTVCCGPGQQGSECEGMTA
jgi:hypothetical protein